MTILRERQVWSRRPERGGRNDIVGKLSPTQRANVRRALRVLHGRYGKWRAVAAALRMKLEVLEAVVNGQRQPQAGHAMRVAEVAGSGVTIDDVLCGRFPGPRACPTCGRSA